MRSTNAHLQTFHKTRQLHSRTIKSPLVLFLVLALTLGAGEFISTLYVPPAFGNMSQLLDETVDPFSRGVELYQKGDLDGALVTLIKAKGLQPRNVPIRLYLAEVYRKLHRFPEAEAELQAAMLLAPTDNRNTLSLAQLYMEQGKYQNAIGLYQQILGKSRGEPEALMGLGMSLEGTNDLSSAADQYKELISRHPGTQLSRAAQSRLERIEKAQKSETTNRYFPVDPDLGEAGLGFWNLNAMPLHVYVDDGEEVRGYRSDMRTLVGHALNAWTAASNGSITFEIDPASPLEESQWKTEDNEGKVLKRLERDLANVPHDPVQSSIHIHWTHHLAGGLGLTWTSRLKNGNPLLSKAHIWLATDKMSDGTSLPDNIPASSAILESQDRMLEEVITHELGHALGLPHSSNPNDIMCSGIYGLNATDRVDQRQLSSRDVRSLAEHYNNFQDNSTPSALLAKLKQSPSNSDGASSSPGTDASSNTASSPGGASSSTLTPFLGEEDGATDKKEEEKSKEDDEEKEKSQKETNSGPYDPLREALFELSSRQYDKSLSALNKVLASNPRHPQAHYVKAVVLVRMRQYGQAALEYKEVLKLSPQSPLGRLAEEGLKKVSF